MTGDAGPVPGTGSAAPGSSSLGPGGIVMDRRLGAARSEDPDAAQPAPSRAFPRRPLCARSLLLPAALPQLGFKELQAVFSLFEFLLFFFDYFLWRFVGETGFREQISRALQHRPRFL